jgi:hypothetical protein
MGERKNSTCAKHRRQDARGVEQLLVADAGLKAAWGNCLQRCLTTYVQIIVLNVEMSSGTQMCESYLTSPLVSRILF